MMFEIDFYQSKSFGLFLFMNECWLLSNAFSKSTEMTAYDFGLLKLWIETHLIIAK